MKTFLLYLTIALVGVGLTVLISNKVTPLQGKVYANSQAYNESMADAIEDGEVPPMPTCAETIELKHKDEAVIAISFICTNAAARSSYQAFINEEYAWTIAVVDDRVRMEREPD
jgi:hypothetical protein